MLTYLSKVDYLVKQLSWAFLIFLVIREVVLFLNCFVISIYALPVYHPPATLAFDVGAATSNARQTATHNVTTFTIVNVHLFVYLQHCKYSDRFCE